jgi:hypothetical protein
VLDEDRADYFIRQFFDLMTWTYVPVVMSGEDDACGMNTA